MTMYIEKEIPALMEGTQRLANQIMQMETAVDGVIDRIRKIEAMIEDMENSRPVLYINEDTALLTSEEADIRFIKGKINDELSDMRNKYLHKGNEKCR
jgi:hypothetical protein